MAAHPWPRPQNGTIGHRGLAAFAPENTLLGLTAAAQKGLTWVEVDIRILKCGTLVIFHDEDLTRTTNGLGKIQSLSYAEVASLDAGNWFHAQFAGARIPTLEALLQHAAALELCVNLELKIESPAEIIMVPKVLDIAKQYAPALKGLPLISSFYWDALETIRVLYPEWPLGYLAETVETAEGLRILQHPYNYLHLCEKHYPPEKLKEFAPHLDRLLIYTVNDPALLTAYHNLGIFGVFSDRG